MNQPELPFTEGGKRKEDDEREEREDDAFKRQRVVRASSRIHIGGPGWVLGRAENVKVEGQPWEVECQVCMGDFTEDEEFVTFFQGDVTAVVCLDDIRTHIEGHINTMGPIRSLVPKIKGSLDLGLIMYALTRDPSFHWQPTDGIQFPASLGLNEKGLLARVQEKYRRLTLFLCPTLRCDNRLAPSNQSPRPVYELCPNCREWICRTCELHRHPKVDSCADMKKYEEAWEAWKNGGRDAILSDLQKARDDRTKSEEERRKAINDAASARMVEETSVRCPGPEGGPPCNRLIQRVSGCNFMICGEDVHKTDPKMKNVGCGTHFRFSVEREKQQERMAEERARHLALVQGEVRFLPAEQIANRLRPFSCSWFDHQVRGYGLECLACDNFFVCLTHEMLAREEHRREHVFRIYKD